MWPTAPKLVHDTPTRTPIYHTSAIHTTTHCRGPCSVSRTHPETLSVCRCPVSSSSFVCPSLALSPSNPCTPRSIDPVCLLCTHAGWAHLLVTLARHRPCVRALRVVPHKRSPPSLATHPSHRLQLHTLATRALTHHFFFSQPLRPRPWPSCQLSHCISPARLGTHKKSTGPHRSAPHSSTPRHEHTRLLPCALPECSRARCDPRSPLPTASATTAHRTHPRQHAQPPRAAPPAIRPLRSSQWLAQWYPWAAYIIGGGCGCGAYCAACGGGGGGGCCCVCACCCAAACAACW